MAKQLVFDEQSRHALKRGIDTLAGAVKTTLGPKGRNVALDQKFARSTAPLRPSDRGRDPFRAQRPGERPSTGRAPSSRTS